MRLCLLGAIAQACFEHVALICAKNDMFSVLSGTLNKFFCKERAKIINDKLFSHLFINLIIRKGQISSGFQHIFPGFDTLILAHSTILKFCAEFSKIK